MIQNVHALILALKAFQSVKAFHKLINQSCFADAARSVKIYAMRIVTFQQVGALGKEKILFVSSPDKFICVLARNVSSDIYRH